MVYLPTFLGDKLVGKYSIHYTLSLWVNHEGFFSIAMVDGRNPAPVDMENLQPPSLTARPWKMMVGGYFPFEMAYFQEDMLNFQGVSNYLQGFDTSQVVSLPTINGTSTTKKLNPGIQNQTRHR